MKILLTILLILSQINTFNYGNYSSSNSNNRYRGSDVPVEQSYRGIGYTTNYSNGQFNSGVYKSSMTTLGYQNRTFTGSYNPSASSSGGSKQSVQPRKVKGYDENGDEIDTGNNRKGNPDDMWNDAYEYYWDGEHWWRHTSAWFIVDWGWKWWNGNRWVTSPRINQPDNTTQYYKDKPTPIGDAIIPLLILLHLYIGYDIFKKESVKKHK